VKENVMSAAFAGKRALITGAGRGIGRALAFGLAEAGADLVLLARSTHQLEDVGAALAERGVGEQCVHVVPADLGDVADRERAIAEIHKLGRIDILVNNAATVEPLGPTTEVPDALLRHAYEVNVFAVYALTRALLPAMIDAGWGRIANISSGVVGRPQSMVRANAYAATKAALEAHTVSLAAELSGTGVTANVYRPGLVDTSMQTHIREQDRDRIGDAMHEKFNRHVTDRLLISPEQSATSLIARLEGEANGEIWLVDASGEGNRAVEGRVPHAAEG
jgi:NAD(P)-dependent dehydrogenase (short-subunit alcohol dehydrogenase family)